MPSPPLKFFPGPPAPAPVELGVGVRPVQKLPRADFLLTGRKGQFLRDLGCELWKAKFKKSQVGSETKPLSDSEAGLGPRV